MLNSSKLDDTSLSGIIKVSLPMMISALSSHLMMILDQLVLAHYSQSAVAGSNSAALWSSVIQCIAFSTTMIAGVYAGHYNGAKKYYMASKPVWQMIYFSCMLFLIAIPSALFLGKYCIPTSLHADGIPYFKCIVFFAPITGITYSLASFFVSIGRGIIVTIAMIVANIVNVVLDIILVFGYCGITCFEGSVGAAIGTVLAWSTNVGILFFFFFSKSIKQKYHTTNKTFIPKMMKKCLKLGLPGGLGHTFEVLAWSTVYYMLASISTDIAVIQTMAFSVNIFLGFIASGLEKGMMAMTSNFLGAQKTQKIKTILCKGVLIQLVFSSMLFIVFYFFPEIITSQFFKFHISEAIQEEAFLVLKLVWIFFMFDGMLWIIAGVIEAGGDINYTMWSIAMCLWGFVAIPAFIMNHYNILSVEKVWTCLIASSISMVVLFLIRYRSKKWIKINVQ